MPGLSHSLSFQPHWRLSGSGSIMAQLFSLLQASPGSPISLVMTQPASTVSAGEHCPCASATSFIPPSDFKHPGPSWCHSILPVWQGRELLIWLSSKNPMAVPTSMGPRAAVALVPVLVPGTLPSQSNLLTVCFSMSSTILASNIYICWDSIGRSLCSSEDCLGVTPVHRGEKTLLPPTLLPSSLPRRKLFYEKSSYKKQQT